MESTEGTRARRAVPSPTERRAWGGAVGPRGRSRARPSCSRAFGRDKTAAQGRPFELDAMGAVDDAIEDGVGQGGICDNLVPSADRYLTGDQQRAAIAAVVDDLKEVAALLC